MTSPSHFKLGTPTGPDPLESSVHFRWTNVWHRQQVAGTERLLIAPASNACALLAELAWAARGPFFLLYVLLVERDALFQRGRYQSPLLERDALERLLTDYTPFFENDGRHHLWVAAPDEGLTLVYDQHDYLFAYGPLAQFEQTLDRRGFRREAAAFAGAPSPHTHHYHPQFDASLHRLMAEFPWNRSELRPGDAG